MDDPPVMVCFICQVSQQADAPETEEWYSLDTGTQTVYCCPQCLAQARANRDSNPGAPPGRG